MKKAEISLKKSCAMGCLILLYLFAALLFFRPIETDDVWWHLSAGRFIVENKHIPEIDPFAFSSEKIRWTLTQWLGSCTYYLAFLAGGELGLQIFRSLFFLMVITLFLLAARKKIPLCFLMPLIFVLSGAIAPFGFLRPLLFNWIFIQIFLILLLGYEKDSRHKKLLWLPGLGILWSNVHLGSFYYGTFLIGIFCFSQWIKFLGSAIEKTSPNTLEENRLVLKRSQYLLGTLILYWLLFIINPYGLSGALYPWKVFFLPGYIHLYKFAGLILEAMSPVYIFSFDGVWFFLLFFLTAAALFVNKKNPFTMILLFAVSLSSFLYSRRNGDFFILTTAYILAECAANIFLKERWEKYRRTKEIELLIYGLLGVILAANILHLVNNKIFWKGKIRRVLALREAPSNPLSALDLLKKNHLTGNIFNNDLYGGYILWKAYPDLKPFVDGRQLNQNAYAIYLEARRNPESLWPSAEKIFQFKIVLVHTDNPANTKFLKYLIKNPQWQIIEAGDGYILFVKREAFPLTEELNQFETHLLSTRPSIEKISAVLKNYPTSQKGIFSIIKEFINPPPSYIDCLEQGITLYDLGFKGAGLEYLYAAFNATHTEEARKGLSFALEDFKQREK